MAPVAIGKLKPQLFVVVLLSATLVACGGGSGGGGGETSNSNPTSSSSSSGGNSSSGSSSGGSTSSGSSGGPGNGSSSGSSDGDMNTPPQITSLEIAPLQAFTDTTLIVTVEASDPDGQPLTTSFSWFVNDQEIPDATTATLAPKYFLKGDQVRVDVVISDGTLKTSGAESISISDSPASLSVSGMPETVQYGVAVIFTASAEDLDGDEFEVRFTARPNGMEIDEEGRVTWTPTGPMFDSFQNVNWELALTQSGEITTAGGTIRVLDEDRLPPLARSGVVLSYSAEHSIASGDFNGDGTRELLLTDLHERLYTLAYDGAGYVQNWMYPYVLPDEDGKISCIAAGDIDGDGRDEMLVGLTTHAYPDPATRILIIDGQSSRLRNFIDIEGGEAVISIRVDEVDNNGQPEIIALLNMEDYDAGGDHRVLVYSGEDLSQVWQSPALMPQTDLAVGDTDGDGTREIVLSGGYVFGHNGTAFDIEWQFADGFGDRIDVGDLDGDGNDEIVGRLNVPDRQMAVYDANSKTLLAKTGRNISDVSVVDPDGDGKFEIAAFPLYDTTLQLYAFDEGVTIPFSIEWEFDLPGRVAEGFIGDTDGDQKPEFVAITQINGQLIIAGQNPEPEIEWLNDDIFEIAQAYLGGTQANFNGAGNKLVFFTSASSRVPEFSSGMRAVQMDPRTGTLKWSRSLTGFGNYWLTGALTDLGQDGIIELLYSDGDTPSIYSFFSDSIVWQAPEMNAVGKAVATGQLNDDGSEDFVIVTDDGNILAYDPKKQVLLWEIDRDRSEEVTIMDLDGDQRDQLVVRDYDSISVYLPDDGGASLQYTQTPESIATALVVEGLLDPDSVGLLQGSEFVAMATGDLDHDGKQEIVLSSPYNDWFSWLIILNHDLTPYSVARTDGIVSRVLVQNYGAGHRNILALSLDNYFLQSRAVFREIDPYTGNTVSTSPTTLPMTKYNDMHLVDTDGDGIPELSYGTSFSMNVTR